MAAQPVPGHQVAPLAVLLEEQPGVEHCFSFRSDFLLSVKAPDTKCCLKRPSRAWWTPINPRNKGEERERTAAGRASPPPRGSLGAWETGGHLFLTYRMWSKK